MYSNSFLKLNYFEFNFHVDITMSIDNVYHVNFR